MNNEYLCIAGDANRPCMVDTGASLLETMRGWVPRVGEDAEAVLLRIGAGTEDEIGCHIGDGYLDPVDVVVDVVNDLAVAGEDMVRIAYIHAVGEGVLDGVEAPSIFVACGDDGLSCRQGAALVIGGRRELPGGLSHLEVLDKEIGVASRIWSVSAEPKHDGDMFLGMGVPFNLGGCHAVIEAGVFAHDTFPVGREVGFQV